MKQTANNRGVIILCGGKSTRMNYPKAMLPFGPELMLQRIVRITNAITPTQVVVSAKEQTLPELPETVLFATDEQPERGPLEGIAAGLHSLPSHVKSVLVTSCDVPLLPADVVRFLFEKMDAEYDIVVPKEERFFHPLLAVYRTTVLPHVEALLAQDRLRPVFLFERVRTNAFPVESLRVADPELQCLRNLNHPEDYANCLTDAGYKMDPQLRARLFADDEG